MGLRSRIRDLAVRMEQSTQEIDREHEQRRQELQLVEELKSALIDRGFELARDQEYPMSSRLIELERGPLAVRIESDRGWGWDIAVAALPGEFYNIQLWREYLERPEKPDEVLPLTRQAEYLTSRLDRIDRLVSDQAESGELSKRLWHLSLDQTERLWPGSTRNMRLEESLGSLLAEAGDVTAQGERPGPFEYARGGVVFAAWPHSSAIELRLGDEIGEAAMRTPSTGPSARGADWITFAPPEWDQHATDRLEAWFRVAWRFAGDR
jgi:hypothetical protein